MFFLISNSLEGRFISSKYSFAAVRSACMDVKTDSLFIARSERDVLVTDGKTLCNSKPSVCTHPEGHHMLES